VQVVWQVSVVPRVFLNLRQRNPLHWVRLKHAVYEVLDLVGQISGNEVSALLDLAEKLGHLVIVEG